MFKFLRATPANLKIDKLGEFAYFKDDHGAYWERTSSFVQTDEALEISFFAIEGDREGAHDIARNAAIKLVLRPEDLWDLIDTKFLTLAQKELPSCSKSNVKELFYIKSLTVTTGNSYEVGFHARGIDVMIELFVRTGRVENIEKDYGCCED